MRQYRGLTKEGKWVYGWYVFCRGYHYILPIHNNSIGFDERWIQKGADDETGWFEVIPETVGQSTGLKDKNGTEIYEGDKIKRHNGEIGYVEFSVGSYILRRMGDYRDWQYIEWPNVYFKDCEVIGNRFEKKDLLNDN